jgi:hypothetical protein
MSSLKIAYFVPIRYQTSLQELPLMAMFVNG